MDNDELTHTIISLKNRVANLESARKGRSGTILVIGGSQYYTGAPYFTALASLYTGSEMVYIFSEPDAIIPLKTLLPESIVCGIEYQEYLLHRITSCVVGPGLGRPSEFTCEEIKRILMYLNTRGIPIIVDGDAIHLRNQLGVNECKNVIMTPNINEQEHIDEMKREFFYVQKGSNDIIVWNDQSFRIEEEGCPKRMAGQGDILAGVIASLVSKCQFPITSNDMLGSIVLSCRLVRATARLSYERCWRSLITRDILEDLRSSFREEFHPNSRCTRFP